jgi:hypothetical protein
MTELTDSQSYRGVKCLHCQQPIAISPLIACIEAEIQENKATESAHQKCQVFHLRCFVCGKEKPYRIGEILEFKGSAPTIAPRIEPASTQPDSFRAKSRSANA